MDTQIEWLLQGDPAIRWQVMRDLQSRPDREISRERACVARAGWGRRLLELQSPDGTWGGGLYTPKWTSTTYTLLLLRFLGLPAENAQVRKGAALLLDAGVYQDGGINLWLPRRRCSETCVTGMVLGIASSFLPDDGRLDGMAAYLLDQQMPDGGWNCRWPGGATHSSLHTTIDALEGLLLYEQCDGKLRDRTREARGRAHEFLARHRMFRSHRTGVVIDSRMTRFSFPPQWRHDVLRGLDYLQAAGAERDSRLSEAIDLVTKRRRPDGRWPLQNPHRGVYHFALEEPGEPSRWNTLRALRVLRWWAPGA